MKNVFQILKKYQRNKHSFDKTSEKEFYVKNRDILTRIPRFSFLMYKDDEEFNVIRANVIIQAYINKTIIEQEAEEIMSLISKQELDKKQLVPILKERIVDLPYFIFEKSKIYVPIFNVPLNIVYTKTPEKLLNYPYNQLKEDFSESVIDLFDTYGANIYDSHFTSLIKIGEHDKQVAFFNYDTYKIYIVNDQGRLDHEIALFDRYIKKIVDNHLLERLQPVINAYFNNDRTGFVEALKEEQFISDKLYSIIKKESYGRKNI